MNMRNGWILVVITAAIVFLGCAKLSQIQPEDTTAVNTSEPTMPPSPGMVKFETDEIELWLPESYIGGDIKNDLDIIVENLRKQGPEFEQMATVIEQNPDMYIIWANDSDIGPSGMLTSAAVTREKVLSTITIDMYLDAAEKQFPSSFQIVDRQLMKVAGFDGGRLEIEFQMSGVTGKELLYVVRDGSNVWVIVFGTGFEEFEQRRVEFEAIIKTFRVKDK